MSQEFDFFFRLLMNLVSVLVIARFTYFTHTRHRNNTASLILFGMGVFCVTALLHQAELSMGFAFGLFAVFSMLRYRTESIEVKEMTYLFLVIAMALITAVAPLHYGFIIAVNLGLCVLAQLLESQWLLPSLKEQDIDYDKIDNIKPEQYPELLRDLRVRTGLNIQRVEIRSIDFLKDIAKVRVHYKPHRQQQPLLSNSEPRTSSSKNNPVQETDIHE